MSSRNRGTCCTSMVLGFAVCVTSAAGQCESRWNDAFTPAAFNGAVENGVIFDDGGGPKLYVKGDFTHAGSARNNIVIAWDGEAWSTTGSPEYMNTGMLRFAVDNDHNPPRLLGVDHNSLITLDRAGWSWLSHGMSSVTVTAVELGPPARPDDLFAGGDFRHDGGQLHAVMLYDGQSWHGVGGALPRDVLDIEWYDDGSGPALFAACETWHWDDKFNGLARWTGSGWARVAPWRETVPRRLCVHDDGRGRRLFGVGHDKLMAWDGVTCEEHMLSVAPAIPAESLVSTTIRGRAELLWAGHDYDSDVSGVWQWNGADAQLVGVIEGDVWRLLPDANGDFGGGVIVMGDFLGVSGVAAKNIARWDGSAWHPLGTTEMGNGAPDARTLVAVGHESSPPLRDRVFVGGIEYAGGRRCRGLAAWDGGQWTDISQYEWTNFYITSMAFGDLGGGDRLFVVGAVGQTRDDSDIGVWDGRTWSLIPSGFDDVVRDLWIGSFRGEPLLVAVGDFQHVGALSARGIAVYDGSTWAALGEGLTGSVSTVAGFDDGSGPSIFVGGGISKAGETLVAGAARWDGSRWHAVGEGFEFEGEPAGAKLFVADAGYGARLFACGRFDASGSERLWSTAEWNGQEWSALGSRFGTYAPTGLVGLETEDGPRLFAYGKMYAGGDLSQGLARWDGEHWVPLADRADYAVREVVPSPMNAGGVFLCGAFTRIGDTPSEGVAEFVPAARLCIGDFDCNGVRDSRDVVEYMDAWAGGEPRADMDGDGVMGQMDYILFMAEWGYGC